MAKKARATAARPDTGKPALDRVGTLATQIVNLMPMLLEKADWAVVAKGAESRVSDQSLVVSKMTQTRRWLEALAELLTEAVPLERLRIER